MTKGQRIKSKREALNISQSELAERIGESKQTLYKYENDLVTNIPSDKIEALARVLETTPSYLMGWDEIPVLNPQEQKTIPQLMKDYSPEEVKRAMALYYKYVGSPRQIQEAVEILLKPDQSDS